MGLPDLNDGGEAGIRTLGTGFGPYNGLAILSTKVPERNANHLQTYHQTKKAAM